MTGLYESSAERPPDAYERARELDPLQLDGFMVELPLVNSAADVDTLITTTEHTLTRIPELLDDAEAIACMRDFDFLLSSLIRHGVDPTQHVTGLEDGLGRIAVVTRTVPRGSVSTYTNANPEGPRQRKFTGTTMERTFIEAVTRSSTALDRAIEAFGNYGYREGSQETSKAIDAMIASIIVVKREVTPNFFTHELRPYFDAMVMGGKRYLGSGGAQLQLVGIDYLLWGANDEDPAYQEFFAENYEYLTVRQRDCVQKALTRYDNKSVVEYVAENGDTETAGFAIEAMRKIKKFRYPHLKVAEDNFRLREVGAVGSGSYTPEILRKLIEKNSNAILRLEGWSHE